MLVHATRAMISLGLVLGVMAAPAIADEPMTGKEIRRLAPGTFRAVVKGKYKLTITLARDGSIVGRIPGLEDRGRWSVRKNQLCIVMPSMTRGHVVCSEVIADNGWYRGRSVAFRKL